MQAYTKNQTKHGNPGESRLLPAGLLVRVEPATNLPNESPIKYWAHPIYGASAWPVETQQWAKDVGVGLREEDLIFPQILTGHTSPETAYVVDDYPYSFRLRCKIRYWLEYKKGRGFRFASQTTNPKKEGEPWNKPKFSTYCMFGGAMCLDNKGHVGWRGLSEYNGLAEKIEWVKQFGAGVPEAGRTLLRVILARSAAYEQAKQKGEVTISLGDKKEIVESEFSPNEWPQVKEQIKKLIADLAPEKTV